MLPFLLLMLLSACSVSAIKQSINQPINAIPRPAYPLKVVNQSIVDSANQPIQLRCANWPGHMETMLPEGLQFQSINQLVSSIVDSGVFNCIRLTYSVDMIAINQSTTARESLLSLNMSQTIDDINQHNPGLIDRSLLDVQTAVVQACDEYNISVLFDNQVSHATWCCSTTDGNGWWNDEYFSVDDWLMSLQRISAHYADPATKTPNAVAFSLRNELRTSKLTRQQQVDDWYKYVPQGIQSINQSNPNALIFVSGLNYDCDFSFLNDKHAHNAWDDVFSQLTSTLVFEAHIYSWSGYGNYTDSCTEILSAFDKAIGYGYQQNRPLVLTELGLNVDKFPTIDTDAAYWHCITAYVKQRKLGFGIWLWAGSYLYRSGAINTPDTFGALTADFAKYKNDKWTLALQGMMINMKEEQHVIADE